jgi:transcriptional regulator with XRE-family HTH domain
MIVGTQYQAIPEDELLEDYYDNLHGAYNSMRETFQTRASQGLTQDDIAAMLSVDKSLISRRLNGGENLTLKTLSFMGSAMKCKVTVQYLPYELDALYDHLQYGDGPSNVDRADSLGKDEASTSNPRGNPALSNANG